MANTISFIGLVVLLFALGGDSADPVTCSTQLHKDLAWYDNVVNNITNKHDMGNEAKLAAMCRALYSVIYRAAQSGCTLPHLRELQNRQRNLFAAGASACLAARPQSHANQLNSRTVAVVAPIFPVSPPVNRAIANKNIYDSLDPCDIRVRNCYLQFQVNLLTRYQLRNHTCDIIESYANCLLALRNCGFFHFLKPLIVKQAMSGTQFAYWETKECPVQRYPPTTVSTLDTVTVSTNAGINKHTSPHSSTDCGRAAYKCVNGKCVSLDSICNAVDDCGDASDEVGCQTGERYNALEIEKIFIKYGCYDVMSTCTALHVRPLLLLLQSGQQSSLDSLCKASNKVFHCAVYESCPLSPQDRTKLSFLLVQSFEQLVSRKTCQLITVSNATSSPTTNNNDTATSSTASTVFTTTTPRVTETHTLFTAPTTDSPRPASIEDTTNFTTTLDATIFTSTVNTTSFSSTLDTTNITSTLDATNLSNTVDTSNLASIVNSTNFSSTSRVADISSATSTPDTTNDNKITNPEINTTAPNFFTDLVSTDSTINPINDSTQGLGNSTVTSPCVRSCDGLQSGSYQSCTSCHMFATCSEGVLYDNRPCPAALLWDDVSKRCEVSSTTCQAPHTCVSSCDGLQTGEYQSCQGCDVYLTCNNGVMFDKRPCPPGLLWNDVNKRCEQFSTTCISSEGKLQP
ncbi:hypothetical protein BsWGS_10518 [Bradybaena similaris]